MKAAFTPGTTFASYRVESLLGRGGMGVVYLAHDPSLERPVALKLIAPELVQDEEFRARFLREPKLAASLDHPNVIPIYEAGEHEGQLYLAMRYVKGTDLRAAARARGEAHARADDRGARADRGRTRRRARARPRPSRREAGQRAARRGGPSLPDGLRHHEAGRGRLDGHRPDGRDARLPRARADPRRAGRRPHRLLRARVRALRVPHRRAAVPAAHRGGDALGAHAGRSASGSRAAGTEPRAGQGAREGEGRALPELARSSSPPPPAPLESPRGTAAGVLARARRRRAGRLLVGGRRPPAAGRGRPPPSRGRETTTGEPSRRRGTASRPSRRAAHSSPRSPRPARGPAASPWARDPCGRSASTARRSCASIRPRARSRSGSGSTRSAADIAAGAGAVWLRATGSCAAWIRARARSRARPSCRPAASIPATSRPRTGATPSSPSAPVRSG